jgi:TPR repeat protein|tara:strand:+ start:180 stop:515 length:336 start_codon:yes stop_codon:yes gene_type:complete
MDVLADMPETGWRRRQGDRRNKMPFSDIEIQPGGLLGADANADEFYQAGLACAAGVGSEMDLISAHKWFNLAVSKGHEEARVQRQEMADMLSSEEVKVALSSARDWLSLAN